MVWYGIKVIGYLDAHDPIIITLIISFGYYLGETFKLNYFLLTKSGLPWT
jgi:hypothetical protein